MGSGRVVTLCYRMLIENPCLPLLLTCLFFLSSTLSIIIIIIIIITLLLLIISYLYHNNYICLPALSFGYPLLNPDLSLSIHITFFILLI